MKHISSQDNLFFKALVKLSNSSRQRSKTGQTLLDGTHLLSAYIATKKTPLHIVVTAEAYADSEIKLYLSELPDVPITQLDAALFSKLSDLKTISGILTMISIPEYHIEPQFGRFCLLLENIQDPGNLGSILRSAAAAGCDAVYMSKGCVDAWSPKVLRAAMGGHFMLSIQEGADLLEVVRLFPGKTFATVLHGNTNLYDSQLMDNIAFIIGNEGAGLSDGLLSVAQPVTIPMPGKIESLNAAAAATICLFEAVRQRSQ